MISHIEVAEALRSQTSGASIFSGLEPQVSFGPWALTLAEWPLARIECHAVKHVSAAMRVASELNIPVTVCGGRQDVWGRNSRSGALVIDLSRMKDVHFSQADSSVEITSGVTAGYLLDFLPPSTVVPTTANRNVGLIGAALGGGYGLLCGSYGLTCDALLAADLVTGDGTLLHVNENENTDLLRALRGGGSGFGVVTSARFRTHSCGQVLAATITLPLDSAETAFVQMQELLDEHPVELGTCPLFIRVPDGQVQLVVTFVWNGPVRVGRLAIERLGKLRGATIKGGQCLPFRDTLDDGEIWPWGRSWFQTTCNVHRLTPEVSGILVEASSQMPVGGMLFLHDFHGEALHQPHGGSAFPVRKQHFVVCAVAPRTGSGSFEDVEQQQAWVNQVSRRIEPVALPGGYVNFLAPSEHERVKEAFGAQANELRSLRHKHDPNDLLRYATARIA